MISISDLVPCGLAVELSGREDAASVLDRLEHQTSLVAATGPRREVYRVQELLRTYLLADLHRQGPQRVAELHATAARWWADQDQPVRALDHAAASGDTALLSDLLHRFAVPLVLNGDHRPLRRALSSLGAQATAADPWLALTSALAHIEVGDLRTAQADLRQARQVLAAARTPRICGCCGRWPSSSPPHRSARRWPLVRVPTRAGELTGAGELPTEPQLQALARLGRGSALLLERDDRAGARADLEAALVLARRHGFDHLAMQCLVLLGVIAGTSGDLRTMRAVSTEALAAVADHGWGSSTWSAAASAMLGLRRAPAQRRPPRPDPCPREALALGSGGCHPHRCGSPCGWCTVPPPSTAATGSPGWPSCSRRAPSSAASAWAQSRPRRLPCSSSARPCCSGTLLRPEPCRAG